jgi:ABC-2 type transport system permease protein
MTVAMNPRTRFEEVRKLAAFLRRDVLVMWSYRLAFFTDWVSLAVQVVTFYFVGRMVDESALPSFHGRQVGYLEFVSIGIAITAFVQLGLTRIVTAIRNEQVMGTLESLLMTPTSMWTIQLGMVAYDLVYVPLRSALFLLLVAVLYNAHFVASGFLPATVLLLVFIPFVWGMGVATAASVLAFKRGGSVTGFGATVLTITSGAYFPLGLFPHWIEVVARANPIAVVNGAARQAILGGAGWGHVLRDVAILAPWSVGALVVGMAAFRWAYQFERRRGTLGQY